MTMIAWQAARLAIDLMGIGKSKNKQSWALWFAAWKAAGQAIY